MKKINRLLAALFAVPAVLLRVIQNRTGFEETGLAVPLNVPGLLLIVLFVAAAAYFTVAARALPGRRANAASLEKAFRLEGNMPGVACAVSGSFLLLLAAAAVVLGRGSLKTLLLAPLAAVSALCLLYAVFALYRGGEVRGVALLVPVCALVVYLIFLYRADAADPVLARIYVEILAASALSFSALELAAFAFRNGSPRLWFPLASVTAILCLAAAADGGSPARLAFFIGSALVELGFLASFELS